MRNELRLVRVDRLECALERHQWEFDLRRADEIDAHWKRRVDALPALHDGRVLLARHLEETVTKERDRALRVGFFETRFSRFLAWRDFGFPGAGVYNCFAMAALRSSDGAFLVGEMSAQTANAGAIYFPCGTPDPSDVRNGRVDLDGSLRRELLEETGITSGEVEFDAGWTIVFAGPRVACVRLAASKLPAAVLVERVERHLTQQERPELAGAHMISRQAQLQDERLPDFVRGYLEPLLSE